jgi:3-oxoacyl-[acyl-carrier protein] reductase
MQLRGKSVVLYGAQNPTGASVARAFAKEGATVYLAGRSTARLQPVAREIMDAGGSVEVAQVDPLEPKSVSEHLHQVVVKHGSVGVSLNLAFLGTEGPARLVNLTDEQFTAASFTRVLSNFVTMAAAARVMAYQGRGTVLAITATERASPLAEMAGPAIGSAAIEALSEQLRADVGSFGVRFAYLGDVPASGEDLVERLFQVLGTAPTASSPPRETGLASDVSNAFPRAELPAGAASS